MLNKHLSTLILSLILLTIMRIGYADSGDEGLGQTIQIYTRFESWVGKPSWLIVIRDLDHGQNIPYLFDIKRGDNFWLLFTYSRNYLITISNLQIGTYSRYNTYKKYHLNNFCGLESNGRIIRAESMYITVNGNITTNADSVDCNVSRFKDTNFTIVPAGTTNSDTTAPQTTTNTTTNTKTSTGGGGGSYSITPGSSNKAAAGSGSSSSSGGGGGGSSSQPSPNKSAVPLAQSLANQSSQAISNIKNTLTPVTNTQ